jgi:hypothetical protein
MEGANGSGKFNGWEFETKKARRSGGRTSAQKRGFSETKKMNFLLLNITARVIFCKEKNYPLHHFRIKRGRSRRAGVRDRWS